MTLAQTLTAMDGATDLAAGDAVTLRRCIFGAGERITQTQADQLFKLNDGAVTVSEPWRGFFLEAMTDFVLRERSPSGHLDEQAAAWLISKVSAREIIRQDIVELMITIMEHADSTPWFYAEFVCLLIKDIILWKRLHHRPIDWRDIERLRRVLFAQGGEGKIKVSQNQAQALLELDDALGEQRPPNWPALVSQAVAAAALFDPPPCKGAANEDGPLMPRGVAGIPPSDQGTRSDFEPATNDDRRLVSAPWTAAAP